MAMIMGATKDLTLQINTSGAWKNLLTFAPERRDEILRATAVLAGVLGDSTTWCLVHPDGKREWLKGPLSPWTPVATALPEPLVDVLVSVNDGLDDEPIVFMGYLKPDGQWYFTSSGADQVIRGVYAWAPVLEPAAQPQKVAA
jgi:hypothetical protein